MKTNNKLHPVFNYILSCINKEIEGNYVEMTTEEKLQHVINCFNSEFNHVQNQKYYPNIQDRMANWLMGLPSCFNVDFENYRIIEIAKEWESLPQDAKEGQENRILNNWFNFIACKFFQLCDRNKIYYRNLI